MKRILIATLLASISTPAMADNIANCELVLLEQIKDENGNGGAQIASYRPAADFLVDLYSDAGEFPTHIDKLAIRAVMCTRNNVIPTKSDFTILATGIPFVLSQNYDSPDSDLVTYYFKDDEFQYQHKGPDMTGEAQFALEKQVAYFNAQEHDLGEQEVSADVEDEPVMEDDIETAPEAEDIAANVEADVEIEAEKSTDQKKLSQDKQRELK